MVGADLRIADHRGNPGAHGGGGVGHGANDGALGAQGMGKTGQGRARSDGQKQRVTIAQGRQPRQGRAHHLWFDRQHRNRRGRGQARIDLHAGAAQPVRGVWVHNMHRRGLHTARQPPGQHGGSHFPAAQQHKAARVDVLHLNTPVALARIMRPAKTRFKGSLALRGVLDVPCALSTPNRIGQGKVQRRLRAVPGPSDQLKGGIEPFGSGKRAMQHPVDLVDPGRLLIRHQQTIAPDHQALLFPKS